MYLVNIKKKLLNMAIEIVDLPSYKMVIFHSYVKVSQRVMYLVYLKGPTRSVVSTASFLSGTTAAFVSWQQSGTAEIC